MLKKMMYIGFVAFFGLGVVANTCLAAMSIRPEVLGKTLPNQQSSVVVKDLENPSNNKKYVKDDDKDYADNEEALQAEQYRENEDLEEMGKKAVWGKKGETI